jgi:hypothetical protein
MRSIPLALLALFSVACASCKAIPDDRSSAYAAEAGQSTIVLRATRDATTLGGCEADFKIGWGQCYLERHNAMPFPSLDFIMTNPGDWAVSDCAAGIFQSGSMAQAGLVSVKLDALKTQAESQGFCILKIETIEKFPNPQDPNQTNNLFMRGGFFIEMVEPGYFPTPSAPDIAFCTKVERTTRGRTKVSKCSPTD